MKTHSAQTLNKEFGIVPRDVAALLLFLAKMEPGDILNSDSIQVTKLEDDSFKLSIASSHIDDLVQDLSLDVVDPLRAMMERHDD